MDGIYDDIHMSQEVLERNQAVKASPFQKVQALTFGLNSGTYNLFFNTIGGQNRRIQVTADEENNVTNQWLAYCVVHDIDPASINAVGVVA